MASNIKYFEVPVTRVSRPFLKLIMASVSVSNSILHANLLSRSYFILVQKMKKVIFGENVFSGRIIYSGMDVNF